MLRRRPEPRRQATTISEGFRRLAMASAAALETQLKLDELRRAVEQARTGLVDLEHCSDEELVALRAEFERLEGRAGGPGVPRAEPR